MTSNPNRRKRADTFRFELNVNAEEEIAAKYVKAGSAIDREGVTSEINNVHDHWVDCIGNEVIRDFHGGHYNEAVAVAGVAM